MRNATKLAISFGSAALMVGGGAFAQPQLGVSGSAGSVGCANLPAGWTNCSIIAEEAGFTQRQIEIGGEQFIQTLISEADATTGAAFDSEDFVRFNSSGQQSVQGILSRLSVAEGTAFSTTSDITAGWAIAPNSLDSRAVISMTIADLPASDPLHFSTAFTVDTTFDAAANTNSLNELIADQTVGLGGNEGDKQRFYTRIGPANNVVTGYQVDPAAQGTADWAATDTVQVVWAAQQVSGAGVFGTQTVNNQANSSFSTFTSQTAPGFWNWDNTAFGAAPPAF